MFVWPIRRKCCRRCWTTCPRPRWTRCCCDWRVGSLFSGHSIISQIFFNARCDRSWWIRSYYCSGRRRVGWWSRRWPCRSSCCCCCGWISFCWSCQKNCFGSGGHPAQSIIIIALIQTRERDSNPDQSCSTKQFWLLEIRSAKAVWPDTMQM